MKKPPIIRITKMEAAGWQIDTAIHLFASENEEVSISTLLHAAWDILWPLLKKAGKSSARNLVSEDGNWEPLNRFYNYCKHSQKDGDRDFEFPENYVEPLISMVIEDFNSLYPEKSSKFMGIFRLWFISKFQIVIDNLLQEANKLFPNLHVMPLKVQKRMLMDALNRLPK